MKKSIAIVLLIAIIMGVFSFAGCGQKDRGMEKLNSYMTSDTSATIKFINHTGKTVYRLEGHLNLFEGSATNQTPITSPRFEWEGVCEDGELVYIDVDVHSSEEDLYSRVNRIGYSLSEISYEESAY